VDLLWEAEGPAVIRGFREPIDLAARSGRVRRPRLRPRKLTKRAGLRVSPLCIGSERCQDLRGLEIWLPPRESSPPGPD